MRFFDCPRSWKFVEFPTHNDTHTHADTLLDVWLTINFDKSWNRLKIFISRETLRHGNNLLFRNFELFHRVRGKNRFLHYFGLFERKIKSTLQSRPCEINFSLVRVKNPTNIKYAIRIFANFQLGNFNHFNSINAE
jgi:hypothetical protein